jgi:hypothetical protein
LRIWFTTDGSLAVVAVLLKAAPENPFIRRYGITCLWKKCLSHRHMPINPATSPNWNFTLWGHDNAAITEGALDRHETTGTGFAGQIWYRNNRPSARPLNADQRDVDRQNAWWQ